MKEVFVVYSLSMDITGTVVANNIRAFDDPYVIKMLDNLSEERMVHLDVLPFPSTERTKNEGLLNKP